MTPPSTRCAESAKRLRYAAESAVPVLGDRAATLAARCAAIQDALGDHHDSVVTRHVLQHVRTSGDVSRTHSRAVLKRLCAREAHHADAHEQEYTVALAELLEHHKRHWLLGS